jgi:hypothetical protein
MKFHALQEQERNADSAAATRLANHKAAIQTYETEDRQKIADFEQKKGRWWEGRVNAVHQGLQTVGKQGGGGLLTAIGGLFILAASSLDRADDKLKIADKKLRHRLRYPKSRRRSKRKVLRTERKRTRASRHKGYSRAARRALTHG